MSRSVLFSLVVLMALLAITVQPAAAAPPEHWSYLWTGTDVIADCGDFDIIDEWTEYGDATTFYDQEGVPVRVQAHARFEEVIRNSVTGKSITTETHGLNWFHVDGESHKVVGRAYHTVVPGVGTVLIDAGHYVFDMELDPPEIVFMVGKHQFWEGDLDGLCAALADS
jgi:hypothetical protein